MVNHLGLAEAGQADLVRRRSRAGARAAELAGAELCELEFLAPRTALVMSFRASSAELPRAFFHRYARIAEQLRARGQEPSSLPFAIYDNNDGNAADVEAGFVIRAEAGSVVATPDMLVRHLPGATVATLTHEGDYSKIEPSYFRLLDWMYDRGLQRSGPFMEVYLNSPLDTAAEDLLTRIMVPARPASAPER